MKKQSIILITFLLFFSVLNAQEYIFGIKGGLNFSTIGKLYHIGTINGGGIGVIPFEDTYYSTNKEEGNHYGAFFMINFDKFFIRGELNFVNLKNRYPLSLKASNWTTERIDIPVLFGIKIYKPLSIYTGPVFSSISTMELEGVEYPIQFKKSAIHITAGMLIDFGRFGFDIRYEYGLKPIESQRIDIVRAIYGTNVAYLLKYNQSQIIVSMHVNILKINGNERRKKVKKGWRGNGRENCPN